MDLLEPALQRYVWAMPGAAEDFLGVENGGDPIAEAWWGAHPLGSATLAEGTRLIDAIAADPERLLGATVAARAGDQLPFLVKFLAIGRPLSIQVHPSVEQAREGYAAEEAAGVPIDARERVFPDANHKPEVVIAATPMRILAGFRPYAATVADLRAVGATRALELAAILEGSADAAPYVHAALAAPVDDDTATAVASAASRSPELRQAAAALAAYPGDPGALVALSLNLVDLEPGDSCFVEAGVVHAYAAGLGVEVQANSDNVVRAGLTSKHVDSDLLLGLAKFDVYVPDITRAAEARGIVHHLARVRDFEVRSLMESSLTFSEGPRIVVGVGGATEVVGKRDQLQVRAGQAAFVAHADGPVDVHTDGFAIVVATAMVRD